MNRSVRNVEDLLHERGVDVTFESVRYWWHRFGYSGRKKADQKERPSSVGEMQSVANWKWHLDEVLEQDKSWKGITYDEPVDHISKVRC